MAVVVGWRVVIEGGVSVCGEGLESEKGLAERYKSLGREEFGQMV